MLSYHMHYREEKVYASTRLVALVIIAFFSFLFYRQVNSDLQTKMLYIGLILGGGVFLSVLHYIFLTMRPQSMVTLRKIFLLVMDFAILTFFIDLMGAYGLFLLPFYVIIIMGSGISYGVKCFYTSLVLSVLSWMVLLVYSPYWREHSDTIAVFAITTFLIPLFYLKFIARVHEENDALNEILTRTSKDANYDTLTSIPNRKMYKSTMLNLIADKEPFALLFIDLNRFKVINDAYGHHIGDLVLQEVVKRLQSNISEEDFLARLGGDEFVIISKRKKAFLPKFLEKLEANVIGKHRVEGIVVPIELSIGISLFPEDGENDMILSKHADEAMYRAKKKRNVYHMFYSDIKS